MKLETRLLLDGNETNIRLETKRRLVTSWLLTSFSLQFHQFLWAHLSQLSFQLRCQFPLELCLYSPPAGFQKQASPAIKYDLEMKSRNEMGQPLQSSPLLEVIYRCLFDPGVTLQHIQIEIQIRWKIVRCKVNKKSMRKQDEEMKIQIVKQPTCSTCRNRIGQVQKQVQKQVGQPDSCLETDCPAGVAHAMFRNKVDTAQAMFRNKLEENQMEKQVGAFHPPAHLNCRNTSWVPNSN